MRIPANPGWIAHVKWVDEDDELRYDVLAWDIDTDTDEVTALSINKGGDLMYISNRDEGATAVWFERPERGVQ